MRLLNRRNAGAVATVALVVLALSLVANVLFVQEHTEREVGASKPVVTDERIVVTASVPSQPGDRVTIDWRPSHRQPLSERVDFYVTEHGQAQRLVEGNTPEPVHTSFTNVSLEFGRGSDGELTLTRPAEGAQSGEQRPRLALVWVFHPPPGETYPDNETSRELLAFHHEGTPVSPEDVAVLQRPAVEAQPFFYAVEALSALVFLAAATIALGTRREEDGRLEEADETEALILLVERGGGHLENVRNVLLFAGVLVLFVGFFGAEAVDNSLLDHPLPPTGSWTTWIQWGFAFVYAGLVACWLTALALAQRALSRWRSRASDPPLDM